MTFVALLGLAFGLAMDATAVAAARGASCSRLRARHVLLVALFFGGFQAFMPFLGWLVGRRLGPLVQSWDHWIAFTLLAAIGAKMLWEARAPEAAGTHSERRDDDLFGVPVLLVLALATSIDALAVGITLPMLDAPLGLSLVTIGLTTAVLSALGLLIGRRFGAALGRRLDVAGGLILIALGAQILFEHLSAG